MSVFYGKTSGTSVESDSIIMLYFSFAVYVLHAIGGSPHEPQEDLKIPTP